MTSGAFPMAKKNTYLAYKTSRKEIWYKKILLWVLVAYLCGEVSAAVGIRGHRERGGTVPVKEHEKEEEEWEHKKGKPSFYFNKWQIVNSFSLIFLLIQIISWD